MSETATAQDFLELEQLYKKKPGAYRRKVVGLIGLGYLYVSLAVVLILGFFLGGAFLFLTGKVSWLLFDNFLKVGIPAVIVAFLMVRAIFVRLPKPEGHYLDGDKKQKVLEFFEDVRKAADGKPIDEVVITHELNAAVQQMPKYGLFGPSTNYLILGVPLLQLMSADEVRAVIAHEFGHLSHEHGRMGAMVYRLDQTLVRAAIAVDEKTKSGSRGWSYKAINWFYQRFSKVTFAMRRGQEYEADATAARATSAEAISSALCRLYALDGPIGDYWNAVWRRPRDSESNSNEAPHTGMLDAVRGTIDAGASANAVESAMQFQTNFADTHPCLKDRLEALDHSAVAEFSLADSALSHIFADAERAEFLQQVDHAWQRWTEPGWTAAHNEFLQAKKERETLSARREELDFDELVRLGSLEEYVENIEAAQPTFAALAAAHPENATAQFHYGRSLLNDDFGRAESALLKCVELDIEYAPSVGQFLEFGYEREGRPEDFDKFRQTLARYDDLVDGANKERETVTLEDNLLGVELGPEASKALIEHLKEIPELKTLYLVEKEVSSFRANPVYLIGYDINYYHDNVESDENKWAARITTDLIAKFPMLGDAFWVVLDKKSPWRQRFIEIDGARHYERPGGTRRSFWGWLKTIYYWILLLVLVGLVIAWLAG